MPTHLSSSPYFSHPVLPLFACIVGREAHSIVFQQQQYFFDDDSRSFVPMEFPDNNTYGRSLPGP